MPYTHGHAVVNVWMLGRSHLASQDHRLWLFIMLGGILPDLALLVFILIEVPRHGASTAFDEIYFEQVWQDISGYMHSIPLSLFASLALSVPLVCVHAKFTKQTCRKVLENTLICVKIQQRMTAPMLQTEGAEQDGHPASCRGESGIENGDRAERGEQQEQRQHGQEEGNPSDCCPDRPGTDDTCLVVRDKEGEQPASCSGENDNENGDRAERGEQQEQQQHGQEGATTGQEGGNPTHSCPDRPGTDDNGCQMFKDRPGYFAVFWTQALWLTATSTFLHAFADIWLHTDDAHSQFLPFTRAKFHSKVSYYDVNDYAWIWAPVEATLAFLACGYMIRNMITGWTRWVIYGVAGSYIFILGGTWLQAIFLVV
jgi:hypothetical protein